ncbi:hypothetical protein FLACOL7796_04154 [Flavobacterium collinsii]|uniref:Uncharacterized protein n=1 Tax=Flavobacterium collinsii TaxID=1114861 RepID=A0ABM8KNX2_9FLAO|nr:hypothetical protein FLACOL7796_04154 [Flavobacterium collinsii]
MDSKTIKLSVLVSIFLSLAIVQIFFLFNYEYKPLPLVPAFLEGLNSIVICLYGKAITRNLEN